MTIKKVIILIGLIYSATLNLRSMNNGSSNINPDDFFSKIYPSYSKIPKKFKKLKKQLNSEFMKKARINGLVSYIYYPYSGDTGHSELEVEDAIWTFKCDPCSITFLSRKIFKIKHYKDGLPFYRYVITITPEQLKKLRENIGKKSFYTFICSLEALSELSKNVDFNVPFLFRMSPLISHYYLSAAKALGSKRIKNIEFYGNKDTNYLIDKGMFRECLLIVMVSFGSFLILAFITGVFLDIKHMQSHT